MRLSGYETCLRYMALRNHFNSESYDFFKYNGKLRLSKESFQNRKDFYSFQKLSRKYGDEELTDFLVANFVYRPDQSKWIGNMFDNEAEEAYMRYKREKESLTYVFKQELSQLKMPEDFKYKKGTPNLLSLFYGDHISIFTLSIIDDIMKLSEVYNKELSDDFIWKLIKFRLKKFKPFLTSYDKNKFSKIFIDAFR